MLSWIISNLATILVTVVLLAVVALVIVHMVKDKKNGKSSCGCGCSECAMRDKCHKN